MSETTLPLGLNLPRVHAGELQFLIEWSGSRAAKFPHFTKWLCEVATAEAQRRCTPGAEAGTVALPEITGAAAACFLMGSFTLTRQPMTDNLAKFVDDVLLKTLCDVAGTLEMLELVEKAKQ